MGITVESQRVAADEIKIVDPGGVILARTLSTVLRLHCKGRVGAGPAAEASVRTVAAEAAGAVDADAAVQAGLLLIPAVVVRLAPRDIAARAGDGAGLRGGDVHHGVKAQARAAHVTIDGQHVAADEITIVNPGGVVLARTLPAVLRLHCKGRVGAGPAAEPSVRTVAGEGRDAVGADAAVQAGAVPAVVVLWARSDIASRAGDAAGLGGGDTVCVRNVVTQLRAGINQITNPEQAH